jgi:hypothetical protein
MKHILARMDRKWLCYASCFYLLGSRMIDLSESARLNVLHRKNYEAVGLRLKPSFSLFCPSLVLSSGLWLVLFIVHANNQPYSGYSPSTSAHGRCRLIDGRLAGPFVSLRIC